MIHEVVVYFTLLRGFSNNNTCSFCCCFSWPVALIFKCIPVPKKQFRIGKQPKRIDSKQANTKVPGESFVESMFAFLYSL